MLLTYVSHIFFCWVTLDWVTPDLVTPDWKEQLTKSMQPFLFRLWGNDNWRKYQSELRNVQSRLINHWAATKGRQSLQMEAAVSVQIREWYWADSAHRAIYWQFIQWPCQYLILKNYMMCVCVWYGLAWSGCNIGSWQHPQLFSICLK